MKPTIVLGALGDDPPRANLYYGLNVLDALRLLPDNSINVCCTSPPYWSLRDYGVGQQVWGGDPDCEHDWGDDIKVPGQTKPSFANSTLGAASGGNAISAEGIKRSVEHSMVPPRSSAFCLRCDAWRGCLGLEPSPDLFVKHIVIIGREINRVLHPSGTFWLNLGDSYMSHAAKDYTNLGGREGQRQKDDKDYRDNIIIGKPRVKGLKDKDLVGVPWRVALALQADGWWLRNDIIWQKCLGAGTRLYARTQKGEMPAMLKDLVRLDPATVELWDGSRWTQVVRWEKVEAEGLEIEFRSGERITCTSEHRWPTQRGLVAGADLVVGDVVLSTALPDNDAASPSCLPDEDVGWFVGLYLAEGSRGDDGKAIQIAGHIKETARYDRLCRIAEDFHGTCQVYAKAGQAATVNLYGPVLHGIIDTYISGRVAQDKHLSMRCWERSNTFLKAVVDGYLHGDGHDDPANPRFRLGFCRNNNLARDLRTLAARLGAILTLKPAFATGFGKRQPIFRGEWRWGRSGHHNEKDRAEVAAIRKAKGRIFYDVEVGGDPHLFATASGLLTHNSNAMPSSVADRFSCKYEHVFLFAKQARYYFDLEAVRVPLESGTYTDDGEFVPSQQWFESGEGSRKMDKTDGQLGALAGSPRRVGRGLFNASGKNPGDIFAVATTGYKGAHFAVWPPMLAERFIKAGSSERGRCPMCRSPWKRIMETAGGSIKHEGTGENLTGDRKGDDPLDYDRLKLKGAGGIEPKKRITTGWGPTCECGPHDPEPCVVLDPFSGSGTTGVVAMRLGRDYTGLDLNPEYLELAMARLEGRKAPQDDDEPDLIGELFA